MATLVLREPGRKTVLTIEAPTHLPRKGDFVRHVDSNLNWEVLRVMHLLDGDQINMLVRPVTAREIIA